MGAVHPATCGGREVSLVLRCEKKWDVACGTGGSSFEELRRRLFGLASQVWRGEKTAVEVYDWIRRTFELSAGTVKTAEIFELLIELEPPRLPRRETNVTRAATRIWELIFPAHR